MLSNVEIIARLALSALLGSLVGLERERLLWAAGLRTHMLVCVGACLTMIVSAFGFADILGQQNVVLDPSRVAAQVVSGIGFLGAGTILLRGEVVRGLTTAASLWAVAAVGLAVGGGLYVASIATTLIVLIILAGVKPLEEHYQARMQTRPCVDAPSDSSGCLRDLCAQVQVLPCVRPVDAAIIAAAGLYGDRGSDPNRCRARDCQEFRVRAAG
ncbi:MgtC/SapB family protein [Methylobacterium sp. WSM2598]|uniref:MgtC/SapB family protein n=1 Tax=Methylobacterium sp. WSM2598 TaxID=398261 RepID=UPI00036F56CC|nr:MgtC/SapB family protein [Methylobacterium sp. WSM2598]